MSEKSHIKIEEMDFLDLKVNVFFHPEQEKDSIYIAFQARNPDSYYTGNIYMNHESGKCTYPDNAIIPEQTIKDTEIVPKFIIVGVEKLNDDIRIKILDKIRSSHRIRNNNKWTELGYTENNSFSE